ncbi:MAG: ATP-binding protein [Chloroflexi bacterium]|nr:ATP-binding protein [Chloroflexota bacterium]
MRALLRQQQDERQSQQRDDRAGGEGPAQSPKVPHGSQHHHDPRTEQEAQRQVDAVGQRPVLRVVLLHQGHEHGRYGQGGEAQQQQQREAQPAADRQEDEHEQGSRQHGGEEHPAAAQSVAEGAARQGLAVLLVNTHKMLQHLHGGRADGSLERRFQTYLRPDLLILDDFGLKPLRPPAPEDLYDVIDERYERGSILLTSNRAPNEWPELLGDPLLASAGLDRLAH